MAQKKSFKGELNPAMQFISTPEEEAQVDATQGATPEGYKVNPLYIETKTRRAQLLLQPSIYEKAIASAKEEGKSFNEYIHALIEAAQEKR